MTDAAAEGGEKKQNVILSFVMHPKNEDLVIITTNNFFSPPEGLFTNPALISLVPQKMSVNVSYADWYVETTNQALGLVYTIPRFDAIGFQVIYFDFGEMEKTINPCRE